MAAVPRTLELTPASALTPDALAGLFAAVYEGYWFPIQLDAAAFRRMARTLDLDLDASPVACADGREVGLAVLGVRAEEDWVGGMGVLPERRRAGIGERLLRDLLERAQAKGIRRVTLEVLEQNEPARLLYERVGFAATRTLDVWTLPAPPPGRAGRPAAGEADVDEALRLIAALRHPAEPWQRAAATISRQRELDDTTRAVALDGGAVVYRVADGRIAVLQLAAPSVETATALLGAALAGSGGGVLLNLPVDDPARPALERLGGEIAARQLEMSLPL